MGKKFLSWCGQGITKFDVIAALLFIVIFTFQPHYADGPLNIFELGLYLPSIDGILHGLVPFRDFFYLRGPLEIYIPSLMMKIFGENVAYLSLYFYIGNVLCLLMACLVGAELLRTRFVFYSFFAALAARTFPRAVFCFWGGLRYVWGLLFVYLMIRAFKTRRGRFFFLAGLVGACAALTSIEIGVSCFFASMASFFLVQLTKNNQENKQLRLWGLNVLGALFVLIPFVLYFVKIKAMFPFIEDMEAVVLKSHPTFMTQLTSSSPRTLLGFLQAMVPGADNFKYMTPLYCFLFITGLLAWRYRRNSFGSSEFALANLLVYSLVLYMEAFRIIEGGQFETVLQVEKILYFVAIEVVVIRFLSRYKKITVILLMGILILSWGYAIDRYFRRSPVMMTMRSQVYSGYHIRKDYESEERLIPLTFERAHGVMTSEQQAQELESVVSAVNHYTSVQDKIFVYPDMGSYYFLCKRGFVGRFPVGTLAWMREDWHREIMKDLNMQMPKLIILKLKLEDDFTKVYFKRRSNEEHFNDIVRFIDDHYDLIVTTPLSGIYLRKK